MRSLPRILVVLTVALIAPWAVAEQSPSALQTPEAPPPADAFAPPPLEHYDELIGVLMSPQEQAAWKRLRSTAARRSFVQQFWALRDPTPGTDANELRDIFLGRARRAEALYTEGTVAGYTTDRGRVSLVYGLPDEQEYRALPPGTDSPELIWRFKRLETPIRFTAREGRFVLEDAPILDQKTFLASAEEELRLPLVAAVGSRLRVPGAAEEEAAPKATVDVAPEVQVWMQLVFSGTQRQQIGLHDHVDFFPAAEGTYTVLVFELDAADLGYAVPPVASENSGSDSQSEQATVGTPLRDASGNLQSPFVNRCGRARLVEEGLLPAAGSSSAEESQRGSEPGAMPEQIPTAALKLFGAVLQGEPGHESTVHQFSVPFCVPSAVPTDEPGAETPPAHVAAPIQGLLRSAVVTLMPGTYRLAWGVYDEVTGKATTRDQMIEVPDFSGAGLRLSSVVVAVPPHRADATPLRTDRVYPGIRLGTVLLDDASERLVDRNATVEVVVIVSGWEPDPDAPGRPRLQVGYRILEPGGDGVARIQAQILDFQVLGQQIPLRQVNMLRPGGTYEVEIRVQDVIGGDTVHTTVPLRLRPGKAEAGVSGADR